MESRSKNNKIIVILGPTSSGKSGIAIQLAKKFDGEIISADSRQVYRGLDIGAGKEPGKWNKKKNVYICEGVPHYAIDIRSPKTDFNVSHFKKYSDNIIENILKRGKVPIICGGTGFWIKAVVDNINYPEVKPNPKLRNRLRNKSKEKLFSMLEKLDPARAKNIDKNNPVRLIRAIEIVKKLGKVPKLKCHPELVSGSKNKEMLKQVQYDNNYKFLQFGISHPKEKLHERIEKRLEARFKAGMIEEVQKLHFKDGLSWKRLESFGLGYRLIPKFFKKEIKTKKELFEKICQSEKDYAKRQMTWFRKDKRIIWLENYKDIEKMTKYFLKK